MTAALRREELVYGFTPEPGLVALEHTPAESGDAMTLFLRHEWTLSSRTEPFRPFLWLTRPDALAGLSTPPEVVRLDGENPFRFLARFATWQELERALAHLRKSTGRAIGDPGAPYFTLRDPVQQFLLSTGRTCFRGMTLPEVSFLFLDIETDCAPDRGFSNADRAEDRVLSIALADGKGWEQFLDGHELDEPALLRRFVEEVRARNPDVIAGHNLFKFDLPYLEARARRYRLSLALGRDGSRPQTHAARFVAAERQVAYPRARLYGRQVVDTYLLALAYDASHRALESHTLKSVARHFGVAAPDRVYLEGDRIADTFRSDPAAFRRYALDDIRETAAITPILLNASFAQCQLLPMPLESVCVRGAAGKIESLLLREYLRAGHSIPAPLPAQPLEGAYTDVFLEGLARPVCHCDVRSLYPSILLRENRNPRNDPLGVFLRLLAYLREFRVDAKARAKEPGLSPAIAGRWDALQSAFKILINSFYGYLAYPQGRFNDYDLAALVTACGRDILHGMVERLRALNARPVEIDTDGIYFIPPSAMEASPEAAARFRQDFEATLPPGIDVEFDGRWPAMYSYKMKNYALLAEDGSVLLKGVALKSRGLEPFLRAFLLEWLTLALHDRAIDIPAMVRRCREDLIARRLPVAALAKTEMLADSPAAYLRKREAGGKSRQPAYEVAIASGRPFQAGDAVTYYVTGDKKNVPVHSHARLVSAFNPAARDENTAFYLAKLDALAKKLDASPPKAPPIDFQPTLF